MLVVKGGILWVYDLTFIMQYTQQNKKPSAKLNNLLAFAQGLLNHSHITQLLSKTYLFLHLLLGLLQDCQII